MVLRIAAPALFVLASFVFTSAAFASEGKEKTETKPAQLESVSCAPECGFKVQSHDSKEIISIVKSHAKKAHHKVVSDQQVKEMMKPVEN